MGYLQVGETYKVNVAALDDDGTEHPHGRIRGNPRDVHTVTVLAINSHRHASVECECGARWIFEDSGGISDARYRLSPVASIAAKSTTTKSAPPRQKVRAGYGRRAR